MTTPSGILRNIVKEKLAQDQLVFSMIIRLVRSVEIASIAKTTGFDSIYIDLEHNSFTLDTAGQICMACLGLGIAPFIRVPSLDPHYIARVLDCGALGIIAPHIQSAQDAAAVVRAAKYPPLGERPFAGALPHLHFRALAASETNRILNDATMVVVMIESEKAATAVDEIAAVPGVDMLFVGTNDLCSSLGVPGQLDHQLVRDVYGLCMQACRRHKKHLGVGGLASRPDLASQFIKLGARYVSVGSDLALLQGAAAQKLKQFV